MKRIAASSMLLMMSAAPALASPAIAADEQTYISISGIDLNKDLLVDNTKAIIPGDKTSRKITILNDGPSSGILKAYLTEVKVGGQSNTSFSDDLVTEWSGALGTGNKTVSRLDVKHEIGVLPLKRGDTTELNVGVNYPLESRIVPTRIVQQTAPNVTFKVLLEMEEAYPSSALRLSIRPVVSESKVVEGTYIVWEMSIHNDGKNVLTDLSILSEYFSRLGVKVYCPEGAIQPGAVAVCTARTKVTSEDVARGSVTLNAQASAAFPDGSILISEEATASVDVDQPSPAPTDPDDPDPTDPDDPTDPGPTDPTDPDTGTDPSDPDDPSPVDPDDTDVSGDGSSPTSPDGSDTGATDTTPVNWVPSGPIVPLAPLVTNPGSGNPAQGGLIKSGELAAQHPWKTMTAGSLMLAAGASILLMIRRIERSES